MWFEIDARKISKAFLIFVFPKKTSKVFHIGHDISSLVDKLYV